MSLTLHLLLGTDILAQAQTLRSIVPEDLETVVLDARDMGGSEEGARKFSVSQLSQLCDSPGFFSSRRVLVFRAFASELDAEQKKQVVAFFEKLADSDDIFVFQEFSASLNKTWKITQWFEKNAQKHDCQPFTWTRKNDAVYKAGVLWAQEYATSVGSTLAGDAAALLLEHTSGDRFFLSQEITKCSLATASIDMPTVRTLCVFEKTDAVFAATHAFLHGKNDTFLFEMRRLHANNAEVFAVLGAFQYAVRQAAGLTLASVSGYNATTAASSLRLAPFQVGQYSGLPLERLRQSAQRLMKAERALKSSDTFSSPILWLAAFLLDDADSYSSL